MSPINPANARLRTLVVIRGYQTNQHLDSASQMPVRSHERILPGATVNDMLHKVVLRYSMELKVH